jgi:hypothetical protein
MTIYAERPARLFRQLLADGLAIAWLVLLVVLGRAAYDLVLQLQAPARGVVQAGEAIRGTFDGAAQTASGVPLVGDDLARALDGGSAAGSSLAQSGMEQLQTIASLALGTGIAIVVVGALPLLVLWLPLRIRYARMASAAVAVRDGDTDLLALRALARAPVRRLLTASDDPASAWRRNDHGVIHRLAAIELGRLGLRPPRRQDSAA